jgi:hypothetical protein
LWNNKLLKLQSNLCTLHWILTSLVHIHTWEIYSFINVYMLVHNGKNIECQDSLMRIRDTQHCSSCIIAGDFNTTINPAEKRGGNIVYDPCCEKLKHFISLVNLIDLKPRNGKFTLIKKRMGLGHIATKLDTYFSFTQIFLEKTSPLVVELSLGSLRS